MKIQSRTSRLITGVTAVCALAIATTASAKNPKEVEFFINNDNGKDKLTVKTKANANDCTWSTIREKGCIKVKKDKKSEIHFHLKNPRDCTLVPGKKWKLNAVYLGGFESKSKPPKDGYGFDNISNADFNMVNRDFNGVDRTTGAVTLVRKTDTKITIKDENEYEYDVWYKIEAICEREDGGDPYTTSFDPRVKNEGTN